MSKIESAVRSGAKLITSGSVQMLIGGVVAAVIPKQVSIIYKAATWIGSTVIAAYAGSKMDAFVDEKIDEAKDVIDEVKENIETIKNTKTEKEETGG